VFEGFGVSSLEEEVYRALLASPSPSRAEIARRVGETSARVAEVFESLRRRGLVSTAPGRASRPIPVPPTEAVETLIRRREKDIDSVRERARELEEELQLATRQRYPLDLIEIVRGQEGVVERWTHLQQTAREEVLEFERPPYATPGLNRLKVDLLRRGLRYRTLYDRESLDFPGNLDLIRSYGELGEEARVYPALPMKLAIGDRSMALVPLLSADPGSGACAIIHASPLLEAVRHLFEMTWERAVPLRDAAPGAEPASPAPDLDEDDRRLLTLLAGGLKDEAIARQLGIGVRTLYRRMERLMGLLGADTRFQAGLQAARRGLL
jgi:sugar-specific transcriptional regulator TrmB/DNA-binding CsgD family transcriptional regulator